MGLQNEEVSELLRGKIPLDILTEITEASFQASTQEQIEVGAGQCSRPSTTVVSVEFALSLGTRLAKALVEIEELEASKGRTQEHDYYRAGEKDCPPELKAPNENCIHCSAVNAERVRRITAPNQMTEDDLLNIEIDRFMGGEQSGENPLYRYYPQTGHVGWCPNYVNDQNLIHKVVETLRYKPGAEWFDFSAALNERMGSLMNCVQASAKEKAQVFLEVMKSTEGLGDQKK